MIKQICKISFVIFPLLLTSCIKDDYDTENCPGQYTITPITPEELGLGKHVELKNTHTTIIFPDGSAGQVEVGSDKVLELYKGMHTVIPVKGEDGNVTLNGKTVGVATDAGGMINDPSDFLGGYSDINISSSVPDWGIVNYDVPTFVQTRLLVLKVKFEGTNTSFIESFAGVVKGITLSRDLNKAFATSGISDHPALTTGSVQYSLSSLDDEGYRMGSRRLLGIDSNVSQMLDLTVNYTGGLHKTYTFDITKDMDGFHTQEITSPWIIKITIHLGADFHADIKDWEAGPEIWMDAH